MEGAGPKSSRWCSACKGRKGPMFYFPKDPEKRESWRLRLGLEAVTDFTRVCGLHFRPEDVKPAVKGRHRLVSHCEPCIKVVDSVKSPSSTATHRALIPRCFVPKCWKSKDDGVTLHNFSRLHERRVQWATIMQLEKTPSGNALICSDHFLPSDFHMSGNKKTLRCTATPSVNLHHVLDGSTEPGSSEGESVGASSTKELVQSVDSGGEQECGDDPGEAVGSISNLTDCDTDLSLDEPLVPICPHKDEGSLNVTGPSGVSVGSCTEEGDGSQTLEGILANSSESDSTIISDVFHTLSSTLKEDIQSVASSTSNTSVNYFHESSERQKSQSTQTRATHFNLFDAISDDTQLKAFTGVCYANFMVLLNLVLELCGDMDDEQIPMKSRIFLTLCKLRLNLSYECLSALVGIDRRLCGSIFSSTLHLLAAVVQHTVYWPSKEESSLNMPECFKNYMDTRVVLDCTEVPIISPHCLKCRIRLYSHYKGGPTAKVLVGAAPSGLIVFLSKVYGGRASDKQIFEESDLIKKNLLEPYVDAVMVDKGFRIDGACSVGIKIHRPPFVLKKKPHDAANAKLNSEIAHARVQIERVIQRMKVFKILQSKIAWAMVPFLDEIFVVIGGLVNLGAPILADNKFLTFKKV